MNVVLKTKVRKLRKYNVKTQVVHENKNPLIRSGFTPAGYCSFIKLSFSAKAINFEQISKIISNLLSCVKTK